MSKVLVLGIGNEIRGDDGVGIHVARYFEKLNLPIFDVKYAGIGGFSLIDYIEGYEKVIIVDAYEKNYDHTKNYKVVIYNINEIIDKSLIYSSHDLSLGMGLQLAKDTVSDLIPDEIKFIAIEIPYQANYSNRLTKHTRKLALQAIMRIYKLLESYNIKIYNKEINGNLVDDEISFLA